MRAGRIPTLEAAQCHSSYGIAGAYELALNSGAKSEFANWVPTDTRQPVQLTPGRWYSMVHANASTVRYQLKLSTGQVTERALGGGTATQTGAANDWTGAISVSSCL
jgi:hypothetical protein